MHLPKGDFLMNETHTPSERETLSDRARYLRDNGISIYPASYRVTHALIDMEELDENDTPHDNTLPERISIAGRVTRIIRDKGEQHIIYLEIADSRATLRVMVDETTAGFALWQCVTHPRRDLIVPGDVLGFEIDTPARLCQTAGHLTLRPSAWHVLGLCLRALPTCPQDPYQYVDYPYIYMAVSLSARQRTQAARRLLPLIRTFAQERNCDEILLTEDRDPLQVFIAEVMSMGKGVYNIYNTCGDQARLDANGTPVQCQHLGMAYPTLPAGEDMTAIETLLHKCAITLHSTSQIMCLPAEKFEQYNAAREAARLDPDLPYPIPPSPDDYLLDFTPPLPRISVRDWLWQHTGFDIAALTSLPQAIAWANRHGVSSRSEDWHTVGAVIQAVFDQYSAVSQPTFFTGFPCTGGQADGLYRLENRDGFTTVSRFLFVVNQKPLAWGGSLIVDPHEYARRFPHDDRVLPIDYGMLPTTSLTLDLDALTMVMTNSASVHDADPLRSRPR